MKIEMPQLPYETDALKPYISASTLDDHFRNYHLGYNEKLSNLISGTRLENANIQTIIFESDGPIFYNAVQVWNHSFYFSSISPRRAYNLNDGFERAIRNSFNSFRELKEEFQNSAASITGQGWVWLIVEESGTLGIIQQNDAESPLRKGLNPILTIDLCDHAFTIDYHNNRIDYIDSFWNLINWKIIEQRYHAVALNNELRKQLKKAF